MKFFIPFDVIEKLKQSSLDEEGIYIFSNFQYDYISDDLIEEKLHTEDLSTENLHKGWSFSASDTNAHAKRIAAIVSLIEKGVSFDPVEMELSPFNKNLNFINDGNHRIRAYQFLKFKGFVANVGGFEEAIDKLKKECLKQLEK